MSQYHANPWIGYHKVLYDIFVYLKIHTNMGRIGYYSMVSDVDLLVFNNNADRAEFMGTSKESYRRRYHNHVVGL